MSSATDAPVVVLEVPVPPVEPKIEAFETLIRAQEEALRRRGLPISLARRGEKELTKQLRDLEASSKKRETTLSQEILVLRKRIADLESERATLLNTITRQNAEKAQCEDNHNSELRALRAQLYHERDEFTAQIDSLRAELEASVTRRKQLEASFEDKEAELRTLRREMATFAEKEIQWRDSEARLHDLESANTKLLAELTDVKVLRQNVQELLAERTALEGERRGWAEQSEEEARRIRRNATQEVAALNAQWEAESGALKAQAQRVTEERQTLQTALKTLEVTLRAEERARVEAEQRTARLTTQISDTAKKVLAERASFTAQQAERDALVAELRAEVVDLSRLRDSEASKWAEEKRLLEAELKFFAEQLRTEKADLITQLDSTKEQTRQQLNACETELASLRTEAEKSLAMYCEQRTAMCLRIEQLEAERRINAETATAERTEKDAEIADKERAIIAVRAELSASVVEHWEQQTRLSIRIKELEDELRAARAQSEESAMQTHTELATRDREILSLRTELSTTVKLEAEHRQQSVQQIERLEAEKRDLQIAAERLARDLAAEQSKPQDRAMQDEITRLSEMLDMESRARKHAEEEHMRVCDLYADALANLHLVDAKAGADRDEIADLTSTCNDLRAELEEAKAALDDETQSQRREQIAQREADSAGAALEAAQAEVAHLREAKEEADVEMIALKGEVDYFVAKLKAQTEIADTERRERSALQVRFAAAEAALLESSEKLQAERHASVLKDTQVSALQHSREDLVQRLAKEKQRVAAEAQRADALSEAMLRAEDERRRLCGMVERVVSHTATSSAAIAAAQEHLKTFDLSALEALLCAARQPVQVPASALDVSVLLRQLEVKSEQLRLERLARKDAESDAALLRIQMQQVRAVEEESGAKLASERLETRRLQNEIASINGARTVEIAALESARKKLADAEEELAHLRSEVQSQQAEMVQTPLRERLATVSQRAAHLTEQAAAFDAQLSQSTELLVAASTPLKPRTPSRLSMIAATGAMPSPLSLSSPAPVVPECESTEADAEVEEETAEIIRTNPLVQSRRRLMRASENTHAAPFSPSLRRASSASTVQSKPLSPANTPAKVDDKAASKEEKKERRASIAEPTATTGSPRRQPRTPKANAAKSPRARITSSFASAPRAPFGKN